MSLDKRFVIVGATGAAGQELLAILAQREHPPEGVRLLASARSAGTRAEYRGQTLVVEELRPDSFRPGEVAVFAAGAGVSWEFAPTAVESGATVIDNSSAYRMDSDVPLVVPEINGAEVRRMDGPGIIASPSCSTIILLMGVNPLRQAFGTERMVVSTYQSASGAGAAATRELETQTGAVLAGAAPVAEVFRENCAFNVFSLDTRVDPGTGRNVEEQMVIDETRKIWGDHLVRLSVTCVRVPVMRAHAQSVNITLDEPATEAEVREELAAAPGVRIIDDRAGNHVPTSPKISGEDDVLVGRIRADESQEWVVQAKVRAFWGYDLLVCGDQLRKGEALNALQIADLLS
jgi:aspartate-semialdehyde dehydrogenase